MTAPSVFIIECHDFGVWLETRNIVGWRLYKEAWRRFVKMRFVCRWHRAKQSYYCHILLCYCGITRNKKNRHSKCSKGGIVLPTQKASRQFCGVVPYSDAHLAMSRINGGINLTATWASKMHTLSTMCTHGSVQKLAYENINGPIKLLKHVRAGQR